MIRLFKKRHLREYYSTSRLTGAVLRPQGGRGHTWDSHTAHGGHGILEFTPVANCYSHRISPLPHCATVVISERVYRSMLRCERCFSCACRIIGDT